MSVGVLAWNIRGLNNPARRNSVRLFLQSCNISLVCLQESKLDRVDAVVVGQILGPTFDGFDFLPMVGTRGGILLAWKKDSLSVPDVHKGELSITIKVSSLSDGKVWMVTSVYGPQEDDDKIMFLEEIQGLGTNI